MQYLHNIPLLFLLFISCSHSYARIDREMTVKIKPGSSECFYESVLAGDELDLEYQVLDGQQLDIDFILFHFKGNVIKAERRRSEGSHKIMMTEDGDYRFCFDNSFSRFSHKTVFFVLFISNPNKEDQEWINAGPYESKEEIYEMKIEDIKDSLDRLRSHISKARIVQDQISAFEARDRNVAENNYTRVNLFSALFVCAMITIGIIQVIMLRSLFDDSSRLHKIWKPKEQRLPKY